jgi:hypothetical protein
MAQSYLVEFHRSLKITIVGGEPRNAVSRIVRMLDTAIISGWVSSRANDNSSNKQGSYRIT